MDCERGLALRAEETTGVSQRMKPLMISISLMPLTILRFTMSGIARPDSIREDIWIKGEMEAY